MENVYRRKIKPSARIHTYQHIDTSPPGQIRRQKEFRSRYYESFDEVSSG
jgi:hypothetical protein